MLRLSDEALSSDLLTDCHERKYSGTSLFRRHEESSVAGMGGMPGGMGGMPGMMGGMPGGMGGMGRGPRQDPPIEYPLSCTLEDLYKGTSKKMRISRNVMEASGSTSRVDETLQVDVKPGWKNRTRITFGEKGDTLSLRIISFL